MRLQYLEPSLLFLFICRLVGEQLFEQGSAIKIVVSDGRILEYDRDAIVPAAILGRMITRSGCSDLQDSAKLYLLLQQGIVVLLEERDEFVGISPFRLVVVLRDEWLVRVDG